MNGHRIHYGGCSFVPPEGLVLQQEASLEQPPSYDGLPCQNSVKTPVSITLISSTVHPDLPDISESPEDMNPDAYPTMLTLTTPGVSSGTSPLSFLHDTGEVLKNHLAGFRMDFCKNDMVGKFPAARAQFSFSTNFRIFRLDFAWLVDEMMATSTMTLTESGVENGWTHLRRFVESVVF
jgi:hypothetical protein